MPMQMRYLVIRLLFNHVLITKTFNEFNDPIYNTNYPAHWGYPSMGSSYQNIGATERVTTNNLGLIQVPGSNYL